MALERCGPAPSPPLQKAIHCCRAHAHPPTPATHPPSLPTCCRRLGGRCLSTSLLRRRIMTPVPRSSRFSSASLREPMNLLNLAEGRYDKQCGWRVRADVRVCES